VVLEYVKSHPRTSRGDLLLRFALDDETQVRAVLRDLCDSQLISAEETATQTLYRAATEDELLALRSAGGMEGFDDLLIALMYREGLLTAAEMAERAQTEQDVIETALERLVSGGRVQEVSDEGTLRYEARALVIPLGAAVGWEAAVFDHFNAMVTTILVRLTNQAASNLEDHVGGSTYTIDVWPGHPLEDEVRGTLRQVRSMLSGLRQRVIDHNQDKERPEEYSRVVIYAGQCLIDESSD
jgi:predicted transcriptional regulator